MSDTLTEFMDIENPPKRVRKSLESYLDNIEYLSSDYMEICRKDLKTIYNNLRIDILGQEKCKKQIMSGLSGKQLTRTFRKSWHRHGWMALRWKRNRSII